MDLTDSRSLWGYLKLLTPYNKGWARFLFILISLKVAQAGTDLFRNLILPANAEALRRHSLTLRSEIPERGQ